MSGTKPKVTSQQRGFLTALRGDVRGNTLAILAISLIPLAGLTGSAVDMGRLYVVKVRLQQACDAQALAGRKFMTDASTSTPLDATATTQANKFFSSNFTSGWMNTSGVTFTPAKTADSQVSGTASATVPMTIMKMFGATTQTITVTCQARYDISDSDIMFVLDTTGSMACTTSGTCVGGTTSYTRPDGTTGYHANETTGSKISGLRSAVLSFYDTLAASSSTSSHIRYGFVTYTSAVNAGYLLPTSYLVTNWSYQSRKVVGDTNVGAATTSTTTSTSQTTCNTRAGRTPATGYAADGSAIVKTVAWVSSNGGKCTTTSQQVQPTWRYGQWPFSVAQFVTGATVTDPSKVTGATSKWQGCIEERDTTVSGTFNIASLPYDLDPDLVPTNDATKWRPMWPDVIYQRNGVVSGTVDYSGSSTTPYGDDPSGYGSYSNVGNSSWMTSGYVSCGKPATRLATMTRSDVSNYVNASDFVPQGGTYHDTGMIWGTRLISPTGIFASDTAAWPGHNAPNRYIVFMTDGDMAPNSSIYGMYGIEQYDQRVTGGTLANDTDYHNARFLAECAAAKARNIKIFVVGFGQTLTTELTTCASPGSAYYASDNASLTAAFQSIAGKVAMLRVSQ